MLYLNKSSQPKATVCADTSCITVYDDAARVINAITVAFALLIAASLLQKAIR